MIPGGLIAGLDTLARYIYDPMRGRFCGAWFLPDEGWMLYAVMQVAEAV